jgi:class 3 adenylate cyclase
MGQALIRAAFLATSVTQVVVWDEEPTESAAGTAIDVEVWRTTGMPTHIIAIPGSTSVDTPRDRTSIGPSRALRAMLFADIKGFSGLTEAQIPKFFTSLMGPLGATLNRFGPAVLYRNTWGDGLYVVLRDVKTAALCTLALQETMRHVDYGGAGLPVTLGLRIGAHAGPVFQAQDPVRDEPTFYGAEVTRTARIEPRTPEGEVYVTDSFAALLALDNDRSLSCQYVGHIPTAKDYGVFPMYVLKRRT